MERESVIIVFHALKRDISMDLELPLNITAKELVAALNKAFDLGIEAEEIRNCYLKSERPIALLKGSRTLEEFGICNGSKITFDQ